MAVLITYIGEKVLYKVQMSNVKYAVFEGYKSGRNFHVIEDPGQPLALYWSGRITDKDKDGWPWAVRRELRRRFGY